MSNTSTTYIDEANGLTILVYRAKKWREAQADITLNGKFHKALFTNYKDQYGKGWCIVSNGLHAFGRTQMEAARALAAQIAEVAR